MICYVLILAMTLMGAIASIFLKRASSSENFIKMLMNMNLYVGGGLYVASALLNIVVLRYLNYSVVLPLTSVTYIWTMVLSYMVLKEKISKKKIMGVICIIIGAVRVAL